jgi:hypothetical protein
MKMAITISIKDKLVHSKWKLVALPAKFQLTYPGLKHKDHELKQVNDGGG